MPSSAPPQPAAKKASPSDAAMLRIVARYGSTLQSQAASLGIDPAVAAAVLSVESGGSAFHNVGGEQKATIRFENHVFRKHFTREGKDAARLAEFDKHFQYDPKEHWKGHRWRASEMASWIDCHKNQTGEYAEFEYAKSLDEDAAYQSISVGMGQILGEGFALAGKRSAKEMYESFDSGENAQIDGTFAFIKNKGGGKLVKALQAGDFPAFVAYYNGSKKGGEKNRDYTQKLTAAADAYRREAGDANEPLGPPPLLGGDPLERMGYYRRPILPTLNQDPPDPPPLPDPRLLPFARKMRQVSTGLTVVGVGAAGVKIGLAHAGGFGTAVTSLGIAGGVLGLLNFATKIADGTLNHPLADQTLLKHADRLGTLGAWLERHEEGVKNAAVASNWIGGAAAALSVASGTMALTGVGLPVAAVLGGIALGLTIGSVLANPVGVVGVGLKVYDGLKFIGRMAVKGADLALYGGMKAAGAAIDAGKATAAFVKDKARKGWDMAKSGVAWLGKKVVGGVKKAAGFAEDKARAAFRWLLANRAWLASSVHGMANDAGAVEGLLATGGLVLAGVGLIPGAQLALAAAGVLEVAAGAVGGLATGLRGLEVGLTVLGRVDGSVSEDEAYESVGRLTVEGLIDLATRGVGRVFRGAVGRHAKGTAKASLEYAGKVVGAGADKVLDLDSEGKPQTRGYPVEGYIQPLLDKGQDFLEKGLQRLATDPAVGFFFPQAALGAKALIAAIAAGRRVNKLIGKLPAMAGHLIKKGVEGGIAAGKAVGHAATSAASFAKEKAAGAWSWLKGKGHAAMDAGIDLAGAGLAAGFGLIGDLAHSRQLHMPLKIVGGVRDGGLTGVFPASGAPPLKDANDAQRHAAIAGGATIFINGVLNTLDEHLESARRLAYEIKKPVVGVFNASDIQTGKSGKGQTGEKSMWRFFGDFIESIDDTTSLDSVNPAIETMTGLLKRYGDPKKPPKGNLNVVAHSQGSIILSKALWRASQEGSISKVDATTFGNATFFFPKGANYHHFVFDDDVIANKLGTNSGAEAFFNATKLGQAVSRHTAKRITGRDNPDVDDAVAHTTILHQGGSGARPHGMTAGWAMQRDPVTGKYVPETDADHDGKQDYVSTMRTFQSLEKAEAGKPKARQTERGQIGVANAFRKTGADLLSQAGLWMMGHGFENSGALVAESGAEAAAEAQFVDTGLFGMDRQKVQRRSPDVGPEPEAGGVVDQILAAGDGHRTVDVPLAAKLGMGSEMGGVRLHTGPAAAEAAREFGAHAFTTGRDVFFGAGRFDPHTAPGQGLLAHELTHVAQQTGNDARFYTPSGGDAMERQAQAAERALVFRSTGNLAVDHVQLDVDEAIKGHANRLSDLTTLAINAAGAELGDHPGEIDRLALDLHLDVEKMTDAEIVDVLRREIVAGVRVAMVPQMISTSFAKESQAIQRVTDIFVDEPGKGYVPPPAIQQFNNSNDVPKDFVSYSGLAWFSTHKQLVDALNGKREGIGIWNGQWVNLGKVAPVLHGEEHNRIRDLFIEKLDIRNVVRERNFEDSFPGPLNAGIPKPSNRTKRIYSNEANIGPHPLLTDEKNRWQLYSGFAFENLWTRAGVLMAHDGQKWVNAMKDYLKDPEAQRLPYPSRALDIEDVLETFQSLTPSAVDVSGQGDDVAHLQTLMIALKAKALTLLKSSFKDILEASALPTDKQHERSSVIFQEKREHMFGDDLKMFKEVQALVYELGEAAFRSGATPDDLAKDTENIGKFGNTDDPEHGLKLWSHRRDASMVHNLKRSLSGSQKPTLITMGGGHVQQRLKELTEIMTNAGGTVHIGDTASLAQQGVKMIAPMYGGVSNNPSTLNNPPTALSNPPAISSNPSATGNGNSTCCIILKAGHAGTTETPMNLGGLPPALRSGIEAHSGFDMSAVQVHYNSSQPAQVGALAYAQGTDIHLGPGQERHLPHEAWHVVQQMQGRVQPTMQTMGASINDDLSLEMEADQMGSQVVTARKEKSATQKKAVGDNVVQRRLPKLNSEAFDYELDMVRDLLVGHMTNMDANEKAHFFMLWSEPLDTDRSPKNKATQQPLKDLMGREKSFLSSINNYDKNIIIEIFNCMFKATGKSKILTSGANSGGRQGLTENDHKNILYLTSKSVIDNIDYVIGDAKSLEMMFGQEYEHAVVSKVFKNIKNQLSNQIATNKSDYVLHADKDHEDWIRSEASASSGSGNIFISENALNELVKNSPDGQRIMVHEAAHKVDSKIIDLSYSVDELEKLSTGERQINAESYAQAYMQSVYRNGKGAWHKINIPKQIDTKKGEREPNDFTKFDDLALKTIDTTKIKVWNAMGNVYETVRIIQSRHDEFYNVSASKIDEVMEKIKWATTPYRPNISSQVDLVRALIEDRTRAIYLADTKKLLNEVNKTIYSTNADAYIYNAVREVFSLILRISPEQSKIYLEKYNKMFNE